MMGLPPVDVNGEVARVLLFDLSDSGVAYEPIETLFLGRHAVDLLVPGLLVFTIASEPLHVALKRLRVVLRIHRSASVSAIS